MINLYNTYLSINLSIFPSALLFTFYLYLEFARHCLNGSRYSRMDQVKFFKGCPLQILLGPFLNNLTQIFLSVS